MNHPLILPLFSVLLAVLFLATLGSRILHAHAPSPTTVNLLQRIHSWWIMIALLGVCFWLGSLALLTLFALLSFFALREFLSLTPTQAEDYYALFLVFFIITPLQYYLIYIDWYALFSIFIPVYAFLLLPAISALQHNTSQFLARTAKIQWALMVCVYALSHAPALLTLHIPGFQGQSVMLLLYLLLVVQASDVFQYIFGKLFGRRKIAPVVSPSKTLEGFVLGGAAATLLGAALAPLTPFSFYQSAALSLAIVIMGFLGGLALSAVKRSLGAKDWGALIEGHGGVLDRMDSVCFSAPIFFHLVRYFFVP